MFVALMYFSLRNKYFDVSDKAPFAALINSTPVTQKRSVIAASPEQIVNDKYPTVLEDGANYGVENLEIVKKIPLGTPLKIEQVQLRKGGVSGSTTCYIFGSVSVDQKTYFFSYVWGSLHSLYQEKPFWTFPAAPWQQEDSKEKYYLPEL